METPEFLVWAIEYSCPVRGFQDGSDPQRAERQLRAARAVSDARRERRVFEGFCVSPPNGFPINDALAVYGGLPPVERACAACPANALARITAESLAGCFGIVPLSPDVTGKIEAVFGRREIKTQYEAQFSPTQPQWYGLWIPSPLARGQCLLVAELLEALAGQVADREPLDEMRAGLKTAIASNLALHVELFPAGRVEGGAWKLVPHCHRCKAPWAEPSVRGCRVCSYDGPPAPDKKRKARGPRPYVPLERLLGVEAAADFLVSYEQFREQCGLTLTAGSRPREGHPDNRRAD